MAMVSYCADVQRGQHAKKSRNLPDSATIGLDVGVPDSATIGLGVGLPDSATIGLGVGLAGSGDGEARRKVN